MDFAVQLIVNVIVKLNLKKHYRNLLRDVVRCFALYILPTVYFVVLTFEFMDEFVIVTIQVKVKAKANHLFFPVILFLVLYRMVLTFESVDETPTPNGKK